MAKLTVEKAKEQGLKIIDTQIKRHGAKNPKAIVKVRAIIDTVHLQKGKEYECHPTVAEILIKAKQVEKVIKKED